MPIMSPQDELEQCRREHARLSTIVLETGTILDVMDKERKPIAEAFNTAWRRRNAIERKIMHLEKKVKYLKPAGERAPRKEKNAEALLAALTPVQMAALRAILEKEGGSK